MATGTSTHSGGPQRRRGRARSGTAPAGRTGGNETADVAPDAAGTADESVAGAEAETSPGSETGSSEGAPGRRTLAEKLDRLFRTTPVPGRQGQREYTYRAAVEAIDRLSVRDGPSISPTYLWELRTGRRDNPTLRHLAALAVLFGVPADFFFDDTTAHRPDAELDLLLALRDPALRDLIRRAAGLSTPGLAALAGMAEHARRLEGLPPSDAVPDPGGAARGASAGPATRRRDRRATGPAAGERGEVGGERS